MKSISNHCSAINAPQSPSPLNPLQLCAFFSAIWIIFSILAFPGRLNEAELSFIQCTLGGVFYLANSRQMTRF